MLKHEVGLEGGRVVDNCQLHALWVVDCSFVLCFWSKHVFYFSADERL